MFIICTDKNYLQKLAQNVVTADGQKIASALNAAKSLMSLMKSIEAKQGSNGNLTEGNIIFRLFIFLHNFILCLPTCSCIIKFDSGNKINSGKNLCTI